MMTKSTAEQLLGLQPGWTDEDRRKAWKKAAQSYHPDREGGNSVKFYEVNDANETLIKYSKQPATCPECRGFGKIFKVIGFNSHGQTCKVCDGKGKVGRANSS